MGFLRNVFGGSGEEYERCGWCEAPIRYGDTSVTVALNTERTVKESGRAVVEVSGSELVLVLCEACGGSVDTGSLRRVLEAQRPGGPNK